jgi:hypothetical protein
MDEPSRDQAVRSLVALLHRHKVLSVTNACELLGTTEEPLSVAEFNAILATCAHDVLLKPGKNPTLALRTPDDHAKVR